MKIASLYIFLLIFLSACQNQNQAQKPQPLMVQTQVIEQSQSHSVRYFNGIVEAAELTPLAFRTEGELIQVLVKPGHKVVKGQLIARLDDSKMQQAYADAKAQYSLSQRQLKRAHSLAEKKLISPADYDELQANVKLSRANFKLMQAQLDYTYLYAPFSGMIAQVPKKAYESVSPGELVASLYRDDLVYVQVDLPESLLAQFDTRKKNTIYQPKVQFAGRTEQHLLTYLEHSSEPSRDTQAYKLWFSMPQTKQPVLPGSSAILEVNLKQAGLSGMDGYLVPMSALDAGDEAGQFVVWKWLKGKVYPVPVQVTQIHSSGAVISEGVEQGDEIVSSGLAQLRAAMPVRKGTTLNKAEPERTAPESTPKNTSPSLQGAKS